MFEGIMRLPVEKIQPYATESIFIEFCTSNFS